MNIMKTNMDDKTNTNNGIDSDSDVDNASDLRQKTVKGSWPRFLVVRSAQIDKPLSKLSPFAIQKGFQGISSTGFTSIKKLRNGDYLVECNSKKASELLQKRSGNLFVDRMIFVGVHEQLNSSKGVIRCPDLQDMTEEDIQEELADQGVVKVQRVFITKGSSKIPTNTLFLTFASANLPESVKVGYLNVRVTLFVPSPLRCFKCQKFGHGSRFCKAQEVCRDCGKPKHDGECDSSRQCVNCGGKHSSSSKDCPKWKLEQEIQKVKAFEKCSFLEAKRKVSDSSQFRDRSFSSVAASPSAPPQTVMNQLLQAVLKLTERISALEARLQHEPSAPKQQVTLSQVEAGSSASAAAASAAAEAGSSASTAAASVAVEADHSASATTASAAKSATVGKGPGHDQVSLDKPDGPLKPPGSSSEVASSASKPIKRKPKKKNHLGSDSWPHTKRYGEHRFLAQGKNTDLREALMNPYAVLTPEDDDIDVDLEDP